MHTSPPPVPPLWGFSCLSSAAARPCTEIFAKAAQGLGKRMCAASGFDISPGLGSPPQHRAHIPQTPAPLQGQQKGWSQRKRPQSSQFQAGISWQSWDERRTPSTRSAAAPTQQG